MNKVRIYTVNIKGNSITKKEIIKCVNKFKEIRYDNYSNPELEIVALNEIIDFDFSLVGHLILFKKILSNLKIKLLLLKNKPYKDDLDDLRQRSVLWKLRQAMVHSYYSTNENIFSIIDTNGEISDTEFRKNSWFVLSRKVLPLIFLNEKNYKDTFETPLSFISVNNIVKSKISTLKEEEIYQKCRKYLFNRKTKNNFIQILSQLAFYRALQTAKILRYYLIKLLDNKKENIESKENLLQIGAVRNKETIREYQENVVSIFDELLKKSPIFHLIYFSIISSDLISSTITNKNINSEKEKLFNLWDFTEELVYGINELAKNIIQHSTTKQGVITGYINNNELNLNVFDYSDEGVLNTLLKSTENTFEKLKAKNVLQEVFKEDLDKIKSDKFKFQNLFEANNDNFLNQQTKRATAHLGLLIFSKLISENNGKLWAHSCNAISNHIDEYSNYESKKIPTTLGTNYEILLPLKFEGENKSRYYQKRSSPTSRGVKDKNSIDKLLKFKEIKLPNENISIGSALKNDYIINICLQDNSFRHREFEEEIWENVYGNFNMSEINDFKGGNSIICINFNKIQHIDASQLFRFLGKWEIEFPTINLVIYNIHTGLYFDLIKINKSFLSPINDLSYWNTDSITLIYSFEELEAQRRFYFTDVLWGQKQEDFFYINSLIKNNNYNALYYHPDFDSEKKYTSNLLDNNMFYDGTSLFPYDLLITHIKNTSLFEYNSKALLCNELKIQVEYKDESKSDDNIPAINSIKKEIERFPGFKISNSHFKLGSKIHISDFYYAKRFFQNSFFASRFAFILAKYIYERHLNKIGANNIKELTIIGYGLYSELLLSLIISFIDKHLKNKEKSISINHNLYNDTEELKLIKGYEKIYKNVIILVPIATTFSTSMKIEEAIQKGENKKNILEHINALVVSNGSMKDKSVLSKDDLEFKYGWREVNYQDKTVDVVSYFNRNQIRKQKYFLSLPSKWFPVKDCDICFPNNINN